MTERKPQVFAAPPQALPSSFSAGASKEGNLSASVGGRPRNSDMAARRKAFIKLLAEGDDVVSAASRSGYVKPSEIRALEVLRDLGWKFPGQEAA